MTNKWSGSGQICEKYRFFAKIDMAPFSYGPGVTRNSNIFYGNYKEMILRLIKNKFIYDEFRQVVYEVVRHWSNVRKTTIFC